MVLGRIAHYTFDLALLSTVLAGVKRASGFEVATSNVPEGIARQSVETLLGVGEAVFDYTTAYSYTSKWFEREQGKKR